MSKSSSKAWAKLELFVGESYPPCIKKILLSSGYNKLMMLAEIDDVKLAKIEEHVNADRSLLTTLKCCYSDIYRKQAEFKFLPGHRGTILDIKVHISRMKAKQAAGKIYTEESTELPTESPTELTIEPPMKKSRRTEIQDDNEPKMQLIASLSTYPMKKLEFDLGDGIISERNILDYKVDQLEDGQKIYSCFFSCPFCPTVIPVKRDSFWKSSNCTTHIKKHIKTFQAQGAKNMSVENVIVEEAEE